jgi:tetratricopeptide (TPR) repeat protein
LWKDVGKWQEAERAGKRAVQLFRELAAQDAAKHQPKLAIALNNLSLVHDKMGDFSAAGDAIAESVALMKRLVQVDEEMHRGTLALNLNNLAQFRERIGEHEAAEIAYEESLEIYRTLTKVNRRKYQSPLASLLSNMGVFYKNRGKWSDAERCYEESLALRRAAAADGLPRSRAETVAILINLATLRIAERRKAEALNLLNEAIGILRELLPENPDLYGGQLATALGNLAVLYYENSRLEEAETILFEAIDLHKSLRTTDHNKVHLARDYSNLGHAYLRWKKWSTAEEFFLHAIRLYRDLYFENRAAYAAALANSLYGLASGYLSARRLPEAQEAIEELVRIRREIAVDPAPENLLSLTQALNLAADVSRQSGNAHAEDSFRVEQFRTARRLMHRNQSHLAYVAVRSGIKLGFERMRHGRLSNGLGTIAQGMLLHFRRKAIDEAAARTADLEKVHHRVAALRKLIQEDWSSNARALAEALEELASRLWGLQERGACITAREEAIAIYEKLLGQGNVHVRLPLINGLRCLGDLHARKFHDAEAEPVYRELLGQLKLAADDISLQSESAATWEKLSLLYGRRGQSETALDAQRRAVEIWDSWAKALEEKYVQRYENSEYSPKIKPRIIPERARCLLRLSYLEEGANHTAESIQAAGEALQISRQLITMGAHLWLEMVTKSLRRMATLQAARGDLDAAQAAYNEAIHCLRSTQQMIEVERKFGIRRRNTRLVQSLEDLSQVLMRQGNLAAATETIDEAIAMRRRAQGTQVAALARDWNTLGRTRYLAADFIRSESAFLKALRFTRKMSGELVSRGRIRLQTQIGLAKTCVASNKRDQAIQTLMAGKQLLRGLPPNQWQIAGWKELGEAFRDLAESDAAEHCTAEADRVSRILNQESAPDVP